MSLISQTLGFTILSPLSVFTVHVIFSRNNSKHSNQMIAIFSIVATQPVLLTAFVLFVLRNHALGNMDLLLIVLYFLFVCTALGYIYFHFFNMSETSRRIRILYEIRNNGSLLQNKIALPYNESDIIQARLKRLTDMGQLRFDGKYYYLNGTLLYWAARVVHIWRKIIFLA